MNKLAKCGMVFKEGTSQWLIETQSQLFQKYGEKNLQNSLTGFNSDIPQNQNIYIEFMASIKSWNVKTVQNRDRHQLSEQFLKYISPIKFNYMTDLRVSFSKVQNLEALTWLDCPLLDKITIVFSYVSNCKSLAKTNFPRLSSLIVKAKFKQPINDLRFASRVKLNPKAPLFVVVMSESRLQNLLQTKQQEIRLFQCQVNYPRFFNKYEDPEYQIQEFSKYQVNLFNEQQDLTV